MMRKFYIAYGSNLSTTQMAVRCPMARLVGKAELSGWRLLFNYYATIEKKDGYSVPGLVWDISPSDEKALDRYEGYPDFYRKEEIPVTVEVLDEDLEPTGEVREVTAMVYIMTGCRRPGLPDHYYEGTLANAYFRFGFDVRVLGKAMEETLAMAESLKRLKEESEALGRAARTH